MRRFLRLAVCALVMFGVAGIDVGASLESGSMSISDAHAKRRRAKVRKHARKRHKKRRVKRARLGPEL